MVQSHAIFKRVRATKIKENLDRAVTTVQRQIGRSAYRTDERLHRAEAGLAKAERRLEKSQPREGIRRR